MELNIAEQVLGANGWNIGFSEESFLVFAPSREDARNLASRQPEKLAEWAKNFGLEATLVRYPSEKKKSYRIPAKIATPAGQNQVSPYSSLSAVSEDQPMFVVDNISKLIYTSPEMGISLEMMKIMERMIQSDRPMFLLTNGEPKDPNGDRQVWLNQLACDMIQSAGNVAVTRSMRDYWNGEDLVSLHQKLRGTSSPFEHRYSAILNDESPDVWFKAVSRYEPIEIDGRSFRLSINQSFELTSKTPKLVAFR